jgi:RNA polymerase sigma factor (TIGR02999 family)
MTSETRESLDHVVPLVYDELRRIARIHLRRVKDFESTLGTTALVNETYLRLVDYSGQSWRDRAHVLALASVTMRHILIDRARARMADKRGGGRASVTLEDEAHGYDRSPAQLLEIEEAVSVLERVDPRLARVVDLRFFAGYSEAEIAEALGVTERTVQRDWQKAKALLKRALVS